MGIVLSAAAATCGGLRRSPPPPPPLSPPDILDAHPSYWKREVQPELAGVFRRFDTNGDGLISAAEMREFYGCSVDEAEEMVAVADRDGDGFISIEELGAVMVGGELEALRAAFDEYDVDGDGVITAEELRRTLPRLIGEDLTAEQCAQMVAAVDSDGDGVISFDEFKAMMAATKDMEA
ncbi:probable calcium-binding protein CML20 [Oryza brachyantha]|uniref:probable calcium-binding protein CML20 n=1 Tax=Oryza brachyantha TaxID=4533 RepID=UPI001ADB4F50|nr:probable calcium-binding protein CML20 [Oryza brachyantha]